MRLILEWNASFSCLFAFVILDVLDLIGIHAVSIIHTRQTGKQLKVSLPTRFWVTCGDRKRRQKKNDFEVRGGF